MLDVDRARLTLGCRAGQADLHLVVSSCLELFSMAEGGYELNTELSMTLQAGLTLRSSALLILADTAWSSGNVISSRCVDFAG